MSRILVTGGAGSIGLEVAHTLLSQGHKVTIFDLAEQLDRVELPSGVDAFRGSILDPVAIHYALQGHEFVIHLAARLGVKRTEVERLVCLNVNINGMVNILEAAVKEKVQKILFSSSSEVYGEQSKMPITEERPVNPASVYAVTKLVGEEYLKAYKKQYGLEYTVIRFFNVYGPDQVGQFVMKRFIDAVKDGRPPEVYGAGDQVRCFCHVKDAADGVVRALLSHRTGGEIINLGNDAEPITMGELADKVVQAAGKKMTPRRVSFSESDREEGREVFNRIPSIEKARNLLGFSPGISLDEGIRELLASENGSSGWADYKAYRNS
jgi:UDP-glucose 4-epimerase